MSKDQSKQNRTPLKRPSSPRGKQTGPKQRSTPPVQPRPQSRQQSTVRRFWQKLAPYKWRLVGALLLILLSVFLSVLGPRILGNAITLIGHSKQLPGGLDYRRLAEILGLGAAVYLTSVLLDAGQGFVFARITTEITYDLRREVSEKVHRLPASYFDAHSRGDLLSCCTNDIDTINQTLSQNLAQVVKAVVTLIGIVAMLLTVSWQLTLIAVTVLPLNVLATGLIVRASQKYYVRQQAGLGRVNGQVEEIFSGHTVMQAFNAEADMIQSFNRDVDQLYQASRRAQTLSGITMPVANFLTNAGFVAVVLGGTILTSGGHLDIGQIMAAVQYVRRLSQPIMQLSQITNIFQQTVAASDRVFSLLDAEEEPAEALGAAAQMEKLQQPTVKKTISFDAVSFAYQEGHPVIKDFNLTVEPGQMTAIVGATGSGKTTLIKLLLRFYDVNSGSIRIGGTDIRDLSRADLRSLFGIVLQDATLFTGSIADNIRYGTPEAGDEAVIEAAKAVHIDRYIRTLPGVYAMEVNDDAAGMSQGQRQLITIARAILKDPPILILDEATSSVDTRTEKQVQKAMQSLQAGRTSFVIAHRLSTIQDADQIVVMDRGKIVELGTHEELLTAGGQYKVLYESQFAGV